MPSRLYLDRPLPERARRPRQWRFLARHEVTLAEVFLNNGYGTGGAGKFHFIPHYQRRLPLMESHPEPYYGFAEFHIGEDLPPPFVRFWQI